MKIYEPPTKGLTITYIGPEGKTYWIGTLTGLRDEYPFALIKNIENHEHSNSN